MITVRTAIIATAAVAAVGTIGYFAIRSLGKGIEKAFEEGVKTAAESATVQAMDEEASPEEEVTSENEETTTEEQPQQSQEENMAYRGNSDKKQKQAPFETVPTEQKSADYVAERKAEARRGDGISPEVKELLARLSKDLDSFPNK